MHRTEKKKVRFHPDVSNTVKSSMKRLPQKPIKNIIPEILSRHHKSFDKTAAYLEQYKHDISRVKPEYRAAYPSFGIWRALRHHAKTKGVPYRTTNVEEYMLSALYPGMPLEHSRILRPSGFSRKLI